MQERTVEEENRYNLRKECSTFFSLYFAKVMSEKSHSVDLSYNISSDSVTGRT